MGKLYGQNPSYYFNLDDRYFDLAIDLACSTAYWESENYHHRKAKENAKNEAGAIGDVLENLQEEMSGRG